MKESVLKNSLARFCFLIFILLVCWFAGKAFSFQVEPFQDFLSQFPKASSGPIFVVLYVVLTFFIVFGAKDVLRISAAILFGGFWSSVFIWIAECANAFVLFILARRLGQEYVVKKFHLQEKDIDHVKKDTGFLSVLALRINPLVPFRLMDLGFGLTTISFKKYFCAILITTFPRVLWLQVILASVGAAFFKNPMVVREYLTVNPAFLIYSNIYFLVVIVLTIIAVRAKCRKRV